jgi:hypothetical protein
MHYEGRLSLSFGSSRLIITIIFGILRYHHEEEMEKEEEEEKEEEKEVEKEEEEPREIHQKAHRETHREEVQRQGVRPVVEELSTGNDYLGMDLNLILTFQHIIY